MSEALHLGPITGLHVWSVDDAWHMGDERGLHSVISYGLSIPEEKYLSFPELDRIIAEVRHRLEKLEQYRLLWSGDWLCFEQLLRVCKLKNIGITFCNFEYFETHFDQINTAGNAVLLEIYSAFRQSEIGIELLHRMLNGKRFKGDIFFFVSYMQRTVDLAEEVIRSDPSWWPLMFIPTVGKLELNDDQSFTRFATKLEALLDYCLQGYVT